IGLQLHSIASRLPITAALLGEAAVITVVVVVIRFVWVPIFTYLPRYLFRSIRERDPYPPWQAPVVIAWAGVRGAVSLAAALALPAAEARAAGRGAERGRRAAQRGRHHRGGDASRAARHRPRGFAPRRLSREDDGARLVVMRLLRGHDPAVVAAQRVGHGEAEARGLCMHAEGAARDDGLAVLRQPQLVVGA